MQKLQLYIEGQRVDLFKDETVSITQTIQNVKDIAKIFTSFTKTFSVPASKVNNKLFEHYYNYDITDGFDARIKKSANIELNTVPYKDGKIRLEGVDLKNNVAHTYRITFFGNTVELPDIIGDDKLGSLPFSSSEFILNYDPTTVKSKLSGTLGTIIAPLITHTQRLFYSSTISSNTDNLFFQNGTIQGVPFSELKYAIRLYEIILQIEDKYSAINFSRDFFNTSNPEFYNLYMWLHRKSGSVSPPQQVTSFLSIVNNYPQSSTQLVGVDGSTISVQSSYVSYPFEVIDNDITVNPTSSVPYTVVIIQQGSGVVFESASGTGNRSFNKPITIQGNANYQIAIRHSTTITFSRISWFIDIEEDEGGGDFVTFFEEIRRNNFTAQDVQDFSVSEQIPDVGIMEFLTGLFKTFNLVAYVNDIGTIVVRPLEGTSGVNHSYYTSADISGNDAPINYDISQYVTTSKSQVNVALPYNKILYKYEGLGTLFAKQHEQLFGTGWGTLAYIGGTNLDGTGDGVNYNASTVNYNVKVPFEHMKYERLINGSNGASTTIQWGFSVNENSQPYIGKPLIFYAIRQTSATPISFIENSTTNTELTNYIIPSNSLYLDSSTGKQNINFNLELNEYTNTNTFTDTLFSDYQSQYIIDVFNQSRRITKVSAIFPLRILFDFKLNDTFTINQRRYIINSVTTNLQTGKSELELLNKV
tara:strand:- start:4447 stop:6549 length:2103 start_codon:yes stop_codon:yes gene_type:complete